MSAPFRIAFLGLDHPHGGGWRKALANLGDAVQVTAIVPRFGGATASLEERHADAARFAVTSRKSDLSHSHSIVAGGLELMS